MNPTAAMGITGFQFITSVNTIKRDDETRKKVRSHARRQKLPNEPAAKQPAQKRASQNERVSKFRVNTKPPPLPSTAAAKQSPSSSSSPWSDTTPTDPSPTSSSLPDPLLADPSSLIDSQPITTYDSIIEDVRAREMQNGWKTNAGMNEFSLSVATELPAFSVLPIRTTPLTDKLFKWMICVCLSPQEKFVQRWFEQCGAPAYFDTYHSSFLALSFSMNPQGDWFDFITVDPAMTHGFMGLVAAMHCALAEWDDMTTIDFHRYEAIKYINKRLNLEGKDNATVSDAVIVSVSLLVHAESFIGSVAAAKAHLMGLRRMVELRGGIVDGFGYSTLLQRTIAWADFAYATASQTSLSFPFIPTLASALDIHNRFLSRSIMINTMSSSPHFNGLTIRNRETIELFELLYSTTQAVNTFEFDKLESLQKERSQMSDSVYLVEYRLCNLEEYIRSRGDTYLLLPPNGMSDSQAMSYSGPMDLSDALVYASHLYLHMVLRGQPPQARSHRLLVEALMASLCEIVMSLNLLSDVWPTGVPDITGQGLGCTPSSGLSAAGWPQTSYEYSESTDSTPDSSKGDAKDELHEDILLWILFVGACVQVPPHPLGSFEVLADCRGFFISTLRKYCLVRGILKMDVLTAKLRDIVWLDSWCEKQLEMIWARMGLDLVSK